MSNPCIRMGLAALCLTVSSTVFPISSANASTITCGERGSSYRLLTPTDSTLHVSISRGDLITWHVVSGENEVHIRLSNQDRVTTAPGRYRASGAEDAFEISMTDSNSTVAVSCFASDPAKGEYTGSYNTATMSANSQTYALNTGIGLNSKARFGGGGNFATKDGIFMSSSNLPSSRFLPADWNAWMSGEVRAYSGGIDGFSLDVVGGIDRLVTPNMMVGVLAGFGRTVVTDTGTPEVANSPMLGLYISNKVSTGLTFDGFVSFAQPAYDTNGASFTASRQSIGLTVSGTFKRGAMAIEPFLFARGYQEAQPGYTAGGGAVIGANNTRSFAATLGVKMAFQGKKPDGALVPYISAGADYRLVSSTLGGTDRMIAPRIGFGLNGKLGQGDISLDIDIGRARSDTIDRGLKLGYELKF